MSYSSRVYRQRNAHAHEEAKQKPFASAQHETGSQTKKSKRVQARLSVNQPGDSFEKEADQAAASLLNKGSRSPAINKKEINAVQRLATPAEDEKLGTNDARIKQDKDIQEKPIQRKEGETKEEEGNVQKMDEPEKEKRKVQRMDESEKNEEQVQKMEEPQREEGDLQKADLPKEEEEKKAPGPVQAKSAVQTGPVSPWVATYLDQSSGKGSPLPTKTLKEMNTGFGVDFSEVRVHHNNEAVAANKDLGAQAFTHGKDIYFSEGKYDPGSAAGKFLLAHELTHVVQQNKGQLGGGIHRQTAYQQVSGYSTPIPAGLRQNKRKEYVSTVNGIKVIIKPDTRSREPGTGAITKFYPAGGMISDVKTYDGTIKSFKGPTPVTLEIQTIYDHDARAGSMATYGRGTTAADQAAGNTSLGFHEGRHGVDFIEFIAANPYPEFRGAVGMTEPVWEKCIAEYEMERDAFFQNMEQVSVQATDCSGKTIDQAMGTGICGP